MHDATVGRGLITDLGLIARCGHRAGCADVSDFGVQWRAFGCRAGDARVAGGCRFYRNRRDEPRLAAGLESTTRVVAFAAVGAPLSYLAAAANLPLHDHYSAPPTALGFNFTHCWLDERRAVTLPCCNRFTRA
jgi:hypothetical protein